jgi:predicted nucleotidyltransferase
MDRDDILSFLRTHKDEMFQHYGVARIGLFGSFARGEASEASDIDIAIELVPGKKSLSNFFAFRRYLEKTFDRKVDLGIESALKPLARDMIGKEIIHV